ncbi:hypothetical protein PR048_001785 [Dryococelus australis]|uniref:Uncharacterized protein n=1 Tax=Dryococelus australis TaxID=614101 RepID=A0ABQ9IIH0_9NEOP|nr:hypothetical protein PR048_001785 [Dryococelus australis]
MLHDTRQYSVAHNSRWWVASLGGLAKRKSDVSERVQEHCRYELSVYDGTIFRGECLVVPQEMRA